MRDEMNAFLSSRLRTMRIADVALHPTHMEELYTPCFGGRDNHICVVYTKDPGICPWVVLLPAEGMHEDVGFPMAGMDDILVTLEVVRGEVDVGSSVDIYAIITKDDWKVCVLEGGMLFLETSTEVFPQKRHERLARQASSEQATRNIALE